MSQRASGSILKRLIKGGAAALLVKVASAVLSFVMFIFIARGMSPESFALFGFGFSAATLIVLGGSVGQRKATLRFVPIYQERDDQASQRGQVRRGYITVTFGCLVLGLLFVGLSNLFASLTGGAYAWSVAFFALVLGLAEYQAHVLRSHGKIVLAFAPREVIWRAAVTGLFAIPAFSLAPPIDVTIGFGIIAIILLGLTLLQGRIHPSTRPQALISDAVDMTDQPLWLRSGLIFCGTGLLRAATPNVAMLLIGVMLPQEGGAFFAALRLAMVVNLVEVASHMLAMPMLSAAHERGDKTSVHSISRFVAVATAVPALAFFLFLLFAGDWALGLYAAEFSHAQSVLVLIAGGHLFKCLCGPGAALLQMMGQEAQFLRLALFVSGSVLLSLVPLIWMFGLYGAALATGLELALIGGLACWVARRKLGVDSSILGLFRAIESAP
ncbi:lipopolysaccharide biosynthesis protein [Tateyamaria sp. Alg231-49]|uniref:lipopolysaccharide biosynthesis protein n=1 Tax=Tateyamaria sp. Alg231-49 TaxID=1922219 RepID=UPI000D55E903|nr:lipopolysaccharide biosynthesis protein [Tateyamaria sp. Alg231-49]